MQKNLKPEFLKDISRYTVTSLEIIHSRAVFGDLELSLNGGAFIGPDYTARNAFTQMCG